MSCENRNFSGSGDDDNGIDHMEVTAAQCQDSADNDGDGLIDCADPDCEGSVFCADAGTDGDADTDADTDIDGELVIDLGGLHIPIEKSVDLDELELTEGKTYVLDLFHAERHTTWSNFRVTTTIACFRSIVII